MILTNKWEKGAIITVQNLVAYNNRFWVQQYNRIAVHCPIVAVIYDEEEISLPLSIAMYQQSLEDVLIFLFFGIGAKVIILFVIRSPRPKVPPGRTILWMGLGIYWTLSALIQMWPTMALATSSALVTHPLLQTFAPFWGRHPIGDTLWSIIIQIVLGIVLLTERENPAGRITLILSAVFSFGLWAVGENWGALTHSSASLVMGSPGAGLLAFIASLGLLTPVSWWSDNKVPRIISILLMILWGLGTIWQAVHFNSLASWQNVWIPQIDKAQPSWLNGLRAMEQHLITRHLIAANMTLSILMAGTEWLFTRRQAGMLFWIIFVITLLVLWSLGQGWGFRPAYGANLNAAPLFLLLVWSTSDHWKTTKSPPRAVSRLSA